MVVAAVLVLLFTIVKLLAMVAMFVIDTLPVPEMFRVDKDASVNVVMVCKPPPTDALETRFTVPGPTPLASCNVNAVVVKPKVVVAGTATVPLRLTVAEFALPAVPA